MRGILFTPEINAVAMANIPVSPIEPTRWRRSVSSSASPRCREQWRRERRPRGSFARCTPIAVEITEYICPVPEFNNESVSAIEVTLNDVDRALERLRAGTYRTCQVCATPIEEPALIADPLLAHCLAHPELA